MKVTKYKLIEDYMLCCMCDSAHDREHIYRVLYVALDIAKHENNVNDDVLLTACLLHDIGRKEQFEDHQLDHAAIGAVKARDFLMENGFDEVFSDKVAACIRAHRYRGENPPREIEEKILFDADKIDATGTLGIARTIFYTGQVGEPLYSLNRDGIVSDGADDTVPSFFQEYKFKLEGLYSKFYTRRGKEIAIQRQNSAVAFYESMFMEVQESYSIGKALISDKLTE